LGASNTTYCTVLHSRRATSDDRRRLLEHLATDPQLAVERVSREIFDEPIGSEEPVAEARHEGLPVPVGADAVELLAHPPALRIVLDLPLVREEDRRRGLFLVRAAAA
jgi:hypothetical protein